MNADHANASVLQSLESIELAVERMSATAICVNQNRIGVIQNRVIFWPAICVNSGFDSDIGRVQSFCQQHATGFVFMSTIAVTWPTSDQSDFLLRRQTLQLDVSELHGHRWSSVSLQSQQSSRSAFLEVIVGHVDGLHIVDEMLEVITVCDDAILVPVFLLDLALNLFRIADAAGDFLFELVTVANQFRGFAAQCQNATVAFTVENPEYVSPASKSAW